MTLTEAKAGLRIPELWRLLDLPGGPATSCKSPFREDRSPSFSVSPDGLLWNDFTSGNGGDAVDFLATATGISNADACRRFLEMATGLPSSPLPAVKRSQAATQARLKPDLEQLVPDMRRGTPQELEALSKLRSVSLAAVMIADGAGLLRFGTWKGKRSWLLLDDERCNAQARRLDGGRWEHIPGTPKAQTLPGCWAGWPLGSISGRQYQHMLIVEGSPDLIAALHFIHAAGREADIFPVAMLGAAQRIHADALHHFAGKRVRIMAHADPAGREGAERWAAQLATVGATVDIADFTGLRKADDTPIKDLNDLTTLHPDDAGQLENLLPE